MLVMQTMVALKKRNARGDFTASGLPDEKVIEKMVGFKVAGKERNVLWQKVIDAENKAKNGEVVTVGSTNKG